MKLNLVVLTFCIVTLGSTTFVNDAYAFKPFECAKSFGSCASKILKIKKLGAAFKAMKSACKGLKHCNKKCGANKSTCKDFYTSIPSVKKTFTKAHWNRICKSTKYPCKEGCKAEYLSESCIAARNKVNGLLWKDDDPKKPKSIAGACLKALQACAPFPQAQCAVAVASCIKSSSKDVIAAAKGVQNSCKDLKSCKNDCLTKKTLRKVRRCKKKCRKSYRKGACKKARSKLVKTVADKGLSCGGAALKACSHAR